MPPTPPPSKPKRGRPRLVKKKHLRRLIEQNPGITVRELADELNVSEGAIYINIKRLNLETPQRRRSAHTKAAEMLAKFRGKINPSQLARQLEKQDSHVRLYIRRAILSERRANPEIKRLYPSPWRLDLYKVQRLLMDYREESPEREDSLTQTDDGWEFLAKHTGVSYDRVREYMYRLEEYRQMQESRAKIKAQTQTSSKPKGANA
jgi:DNA-binding Lrp family transcriptional regulator